MEDQKVGSYENKVLIQALPQNIYGKFVNFFEDSQNYPNIIFVLQVPNSHGETKR